MIHALLLCASAFAAQPTPTPTFTEWQKGFVAAMKTMEAIEDRAWKKFDKDLDITATAIAREYGMGWPAGQWIVTATATATRTPTPWPTPNFEATCISFGHDWESKIPPQVQRCRRCGLWREKPE